MDTPIDSTDGVSYQGADRVNPMQQSEREKQRRSSRAPRDKFEEELNRQRKKQADQDELLLEGDDREPTEEAPAKAEQNDQDNKKDTAEGTVEEDDPGSPSHIDLKA